MSTEKKILIVLPNDSLGGAEQVLKMIALHYKDESVSVQFLTEKKSQGWESLPPHIQLYYGKVASEYLGALLWGVSLFKNEKRVYHYIFTSHVFVTGMVGIMRRLGLIRCQYFIGRESTTIFKRFEGFKLWLYKMMYKLGYPAVDLLICQTEDMERELIKALPKLQRVTSLTVIPNPVDLTKATMVKTDIIEVTTAKYIVSAGRLIPEKGFDLLIMAFENLKQQHSDLKLVILGEGPERGYLEGLIKEYNLEGKVVLNGFVENVYPFFQMAEVCVVSSRVEGFPNVLLQMMSQNTKVISTKCAGGIEEISGIFSCEANDKIALLHSLELALATETSFYRVVFDDYLKERSIEKFVAKAEDALQRSIKKRNST